MYREKDYNVFGSRIPIHTLKCYTSANTKASIPLRIENFVCVIFMLYSHNITTQLEICLSKEDEKRKLKINAYELRVITEGYKLDSYKLIGGGEYILFVGIVSSALRTVEKSGDFQTRYTDFKKQFNDTPGLDIHNRHKTSFNLYKAKMIDDYQFNPGDEETGFDMRDVHIRTQMRTRYIEELFYAQINSMFDAKIKVLFDSHQMQTEFREILFGNSNDIVLKQNQNCRSIYLKLQIHQYLKGMEGDIETTDRYMLKKETEAYTDQFQSLKRDILQGGHLPGLISYYQLHVDKLSEVLNSTYRDNNGEPLTSNQRN